MIKNFVTLWETHKHELEEVIRTTPQSKYADYQNLVVLLCRHVINKGKVKYLIDKMTVIDDGDYQGTMLFIIPKCTYQPSKDDYITTYVSYGSCSGCDTLLGISGYGTGLPSDDQVKDYMSLLLHLLQNFKYLGDVKADE